MGIVSGMWPWDCQAPGNIRASQVGSKAMFRSSLSLLILSHPLCCWQQVRESPTVLLVVGTCVTHCAVGSRYVCALQVSPPVMTNSLLHPRLLEYIVIFDFQDLGHFQLPVLFTHVMYAQMYVYNTLIPRPSHSFPSIACRTVSGRSPGIFSHVSDVTGRANYANVGIM